MEPVRSLSEEWVQRIGEAFDLLEGLPAEGMTFDEIAPLISGLGRLRARVDSATGALIRGLKSVRPDVDPAMTLRSLTRMTGRQARKIARVAEGLARMPEADRRLANGDITLEHAASLTNAAAELGSPQVVDDAPELLAAAEDVPADRFARHVRHWTVLQQASRGVDSLERQHRARTGSKFEDRVTGNRVFRFVLDPIRANVVDQVLDTRYDHLWQQDRSGRRQADETRTPAQRRADAFFEIATGRDALTLRPLQNVEALLSPPVQLLLVSEVGVIDGTKPDGRNEIIGTGPVPRRILEQLSPDTELAAAIFSGEGRLLWLGRRRRLANAAQRLGVAIQQGGCFECGAPMHLCQLHHIKEWDRDQGPTDIDNLVAVCRTHHKWITDNNLQVHRTPRGWATRPRDRPA